MPGIQELLVIAVVALLVFGPERLPEFARRAAQLLVRLRTEAQRNVEEFRRLAAVDDIERDLREVADELKRAPEGPRPGRPPRTGVPPTDPDAT